jgi:kynurenine formamidase
VKPAHVLSEPTDDELLDMARDLSNWGRWGTTDKLGTLNFITDDIRRTAALEVTSGRTISLSRTIVPKASPPDTHAPLHFMIVAGEGGPTTGFHAALDWYGIAPHGHMTTHLDSLGHVFWNGKMYNDRDASRVEQATGAKDGSIEDAGGGILTRGLLLDVPRALGVERLPPGYRVSPHDLEAAATLAEVQIRPGDAVLIRTGRDVPLSSSGSSGHQEGQPGLSARCMPWLHQHEVALLGSDCAQDATPPSSTVMEMPVHSIGIVSMGLWILDNAYLEELARAVVQQHQGHFLLAIAPLKLKRGTGSAVNPIALF